MAMKMANEIEALAPLFEHLDALTGRADIAELERAMRAVHVTPDDVAEHLRYCDEHYKRNLIREGKWYQVFALCWKSGQRSPIHDHTNTTCGVRVLLGRGVETVYEPSPCGMMMATRSHELNVGDICASQDSDTHQISNLQPAGQNLVTLHIYSPPLREFHTYSATDGTVNRVRDVGNGCCEVVETMDIAEFMSR
ncbi:MAG: cysteine dioxygenase family protein [Phycisphaerales bacterium]|nr:cysteine dioxygenase family protein [Phycisphaerales bacterium]